MISCEGCTDRGMAINNAFGVLLRMQKGRSLSTEDREWLKGAIAVCEEIELGKKLHKENGRITNKGELNATRTFKEELDAERAFRPNGKTSILTVAKIKSAKPLLNLLRKVGQGEHLSDGEFSRAFNAAHKLDDAYASFAFEKLHGMEVAERAFRGA